MSKVRNAIKKMKPNLRKSNEQGARRAVLEDLFYDFHASRAQVYKMNFVRGIFFGFGSILGGTIVIALTVWMLSLFANIFPPLESFFTTVSREIEQPK